MYSFDIVEKYRLTSSTARSNHLNKFFWIITAYIVAILAAIVAFFDTTGGVFWQILYADFAATLVIFLFSYRFKNSSFYDAYWSVAPIVIVIALFLAVNEGNLTRQILASLFVTAWGVRLTGNWGYGWQGLDHEDWRYQQLQEQTGMFYWLVSLFGIHLFPTALVFLGCIPLIAVFSNDSALNLFDLLAVMVTSAAIWLEAQADRELHQFRRSSEPGEILKSGVWSWCRHPNYLGEIGFWVGVFIFGYSALGGATDLMKAGPIAMVLLFIIVSIPMIDKRLVANKPGYEDHKKQSFALIPFSKLR